MITYNFNTVIVGSGAAAYCAAERLFMLGQEDLVIVTENRLCGTSRNTGSDKQTYYKLTLSGDEPDSVREMAATLFSGSCVDGDIALCEAALSAQGFLHLCDLGVPFPRNRYGEYIGYKTDHDPRRRATSVGPYTSKMMTESLEKSVVKLDIDYHDKTQVIKILTENEQLRGILCLNQDNEYVAYKCKNLIYATGGPAGMYKNSVYPNGHLGSSGIAFDAGIKGKNLTEWQYGLASVKPRWNVSGTYMQVLPKFISCEQDGSDEKEFLLDFFKDEGDMLSKIFLKGYQWPFDVRKIDGGSSIIDILVYIEISKNRRVFLDYRENSKGEVPNFELMSKECFEYLQKAKACFGKPIDRLLYMNKPAVDFYMDRGVDLTKEPLEISLSAQHNNGGIAIDCWWQSNICGIFAIGEVAGSHGVYRPGGSALNAGQVGALRASQYIAKKCIVETDFDLPVKEIEQFIKIMPDFCENDNVEEIILDITQDMSDFGSAIRDRSGILKLQKKVKSLIQNFPDIVKISSGKKLKKAYRLYDILISQYVYLSSMMNYIDVKGESRGSSLYTDRNGFKPYQELDETFRYSLSKNDDQIQEVTYKNGACEFSWRIPRPIPEDDDFFENVWREYRENENIY